MFIPVLIFAIMFAVVPTNVEANASVKLKSVKATYAQQQKLNKLSKKSKSNCYLAVDSKTKKQYTVCHK
jgi:hypothetical protein